jgi:hypothetical protein
MYGPMWGSAIWFTRRTRTPFLIIEFDLIEFQISGTSTSEIRNPIANICIGNTVTCLHLLKCQLQHQFFQIVL